MKNLQTFEEFLNENIKPYIEFIYDKPFDNTTIQGVSADGFKGITIKGNHLDLKNKYSDLNIAIKDILRSNKYHIIDVMK